MTVPGFGFWDYAVMLGFFGLSSIIGLFFAWQDRKENDNEAFLVGKKQMHWFPVCLSMASSHLSGISMLGLPAQTFVYGSIMWMGAINSTLGILAALYIFMPLYYNMNLTSINEYLERRFMSRKMKLLGSLSFMIQQFMYLGVVLYGPSLALVSVSGIPVWSSILINGLVATIYTSLGGIKAVVWTDAFQMILIYVGILMAIFGGINHIGGFGNLIESATKGRRLIIANFSPSLYETYTTWGLLFSWSLTWLTVYCASQIQMQRYCSLPTIQDCRKALWLNIPLVGGTLFISVLSGLVLYAVYGKCDPRIYGDIERNDQLMPYIIQDLLRNIPGASGLFVSSVFSGSLSTLSAGYNSLSAITWCDFVKPNVSWSGKQSLLFTKIAASCFGLLSIAVAFLAGTLESIILAVHSLTGAMNGPIFGLFFVAAFMPYVKANGAIFGTITGILTAFWLATGSMLYPRNNKPLFTTTAECPASIYNGTVKTLGSWDNIVHMPEGILLFYNVSFVWIELFGFLSTVVTSFLATQILDRNDDREVNDEYLAFFIRKRNGKKQEGLSLTKVIRNGSLT